MLQRKQSIFMAITAILMITTLFIPVGKIDFEQELYIMDHLPLMLLCMTIIATQAYNLSLYKSRRKQLKLNYYSLFLLLIMLGVFHFYVHEDPLSFEISSLLEKIQLGSTLPIIGVISQILAIKGIKDDENLIKSMNRFR